MFVLVSLCRFLWQIILLTYSDTSYKLVAHFDLSRLRSVSLFRAISEFQVIILKQFTIFKSEQIQWILY